MIRRRLLRRLFYSYLLITVTTLVAITWYASGSLRRFYYNEAAGNLKARAKLIELKVLPELKSQNYEAVNELCDRLGKTIETRITVILPDGKVIADSDEDYKIMKNHSDRPEIKQALVEGLGSSIRFSNTLGKRMMYVAQSVKEDNQPLAVIRTSFAVTAIDEHLSRIYKRMLWALIIIICLSAVIFLGVSRKLTLPIDRMTAMAKRFATGELDLRVQVSKSGQLADLAKALNEMAKQLSDRIATITSQRNESEAILAGMVEGVLAIDASGRIVKINKATALLLDIDGENARGRNVEEVIRNPDLQQFINNTLEGKTPAETDVLLRSHDGRYFQVHGTKLVAEKAQSGAVIVLNDMTKTHRLEQVRKDFVSNVSHELKTPITSIKGFVETLREGAIKDPQKAEKFLEIIAKHSDRLNAIIEDLLSLSRLDEQTEKRNVSFEIQSIKPIILSAIELSRPKAEEKKIGIEILCEENIRTPVNSALLEQAVLNLVDNSIKYSDSGGKITIVVTRTNNEVMISVKDNGCGIEKRHLSRIFERFYVVDKARSRKLGGTGLGLAIVKHISQVHGGNVTAESTVGAGSVFTIFIPEASE